MLQPHVFFESAGVKFRQSENDTLLYDDGAHLLLAVSQTSLRLYNLKQPEQGTRVVRLTDGPPVAAVHVSLDGSMLALQRSPNNLQFMDLSSQKTFVQGAWKGKAPVKGFFWTSAKDYNFVFVTAAGLETYLLLENRQGLKLTNQFLHPVKWWRYSHEARVLLLGTGDIGLWLQAYQFTPEGMLKLPPFQVAASTPSGTTTPPAQARLDPDTIHLLTVYSRVYCAAVDRAERKLLLYRFYKDAVLLQHQYDIASSSIELSVADNLILVHYIKSGQAQIFDVSGNGPIAPPQPIAFRAESQTSSESDPHSVRARIRSLRFELPNVVIDQLGGAVWRCRVDVEAIAKSSRSWPTMAAFLLRRNPQKGMDISRLVISIMKEALVERAEMEVVRQLFDTVNAHHAAAGLQKPAGSAFPLVELTPQEVCKEVFAWLHDEEVVDAQYLQAAVVEYQASADMLGVDLPLHLQILAFDIALQQGYSDQVAAISTLVTDSDCKELAGQLEAWAAAGQLPQGQQLADDMRARIEVHAQRIPSLLAQGQVLRAARVIQQHRNASVSCEALAEAAGSLGSVAAFSAAFRYCQGDGAAAGLGDF